VFYRRKILLALLEVFGGALAKTDCQKLMLLFCLRRGKNYYDFFPYKHGNYSLLLVQDWNRLIDLGHLAKQDELCLSDGQSYYKQLQAEDRLTLQALVAEVGDVRGEELIRKVYLEIPYYASRSEIAEKILKKEEYPLLKQNKKSTDLSYLFTIGYEGLSIDAFLNMLLANNILALVDVRKNPISMKYGFSKVRFANSVKLAGLLYFHLPDLGVPSVLRQNLQSPLAYQKLFERYSREILPHQTEALEKLKTIIKEQKRVAITCFEADYHFCHRQKIAEYMEQEPSFGVSVIHLQKKFTYNSSLVYNKNIKSSQMRDALRE
jgi:uncharacterized protein YwgA